MIGQQFVKAAAGLATEATLAAPAVAQVRTRFRLGHLHVVAVDAHIWTGLDRGSLDKQGLDFDLFEFNTGPQVFEAMAKGRLDVLSAGGVISNCLALGRGRAFVMNDIEIATAQLWVNSNAESARFRT
jgi:NitT/TauT family transport system substrate-binding protein